MIAAACCTTATSAGVKVAAMTADGRSGGAADSGGCRRASFGDHGCAAATVRLSSRVDDGDGGGVAGRPVPSLPTTPGGDGALGNAAPGPNPTPILYGTPIPNLGRAVGCNWGGNGANAALPPWTRLPPSLQVPPWISTPEEAPTFCSIAAGFAVSGFVRAFVRSLSPGSSSVMVVPPGCRTDATAVRGY
ncbi:hypothetical protein Vafri_17935 [Volvox africanus]|uniref:Uncharacterized protein n=1 Tax=Volvox africanus TaxID=51714 RepID=A0A8J4BRK2_9CHLO|nr:hypothetical protein Vafri_17935 [Volvox africanus]